MTWADYNRYAYGKLKRDTQKWEHTRVMLSMIYNTNVTKRHDQRTPEKILPLWTDRIGKQKKPKLDPISERDFKKVVNKLENNG